MPQGIGLDTLSMGMSGDFAAAIAEERDARPDRHGDLWRARLESVRGRALLPPRLDPQLRGLRVPAARAAPARARRLPEPARTGGRRADQLAACCRFDGSLPRGGRFDTASLVALLAVQLVATLVLFRVRTGVIFPFVSLACIASARALASRRCLLYTILIFVYAALSFIAPGVRSPATGLLAALCEPVLRPLRRVLAGHRRHRLLAARRDPRPHGAPDPDPLTMPLRRLGTGRGPQATTAPPWQKRRDSGGFRAIQMRPRGHGRGCRLQPAAGCGGESGPVPEAPPYMDPGFTEAGAYRLYYALTLSRDLPSANCGQLRHPAETQSSCARAHARAER